MATHKMKTTAHKGLFCFTKEQGSIGTPSICGSENKGGLHTGMWL